MSLGLVFEDSQPLKLFHHLDARTEKSLVLVPSGMVGPGDGRWVLVRVCRPAKN